MLHGRQNSTASAASMMAEPSSLSYVQRMRMSTATVWAERGPKGSLDQSRVKKVNSGRRSKFRLFNSGTQAPPPVKQSGKLKLVQLSATGSNALVPRLSSTEAYDNDDDDYGQFAGFSTGGRDSFNARRPGSPNRPSSIGGYGGMPRVDEGQEPISATMRSNTFGGYGGASNMSSTTVGQGQSQSHAHGPPGQHVRNGSSSNHNSAAAGAMPRRMDSMVSSAASSAMMPDADFHRRSQSFARFDPSSAHQSRAGSPTQMQTYQTAPSTGAHAHHHTGPGAAGRHDMSSDDEIEIQMPRQRLFVANADAGSDSD